MPLSPPPLSLYVHLPWCVRKCPYCDFNSHALRDDIDETGYVAALLQDLESDAAYVTGRTVDTIFFGGGTPSLFSATAIGSLLDGIAARVAIAPTAEITLEANPGTVDNARFRGYRDAGVNRLSIGVQSFDDEKLHALGRIHGGNDAVAAARIARDAGFDNFNLDLMYGLPGQALSQALTDIERAIELEPTHLSAYQLTLEPNTWFHAHPPVLPADATIDEMHEALVERLAAHGFAQYEVSAYARPNRQCRHNRNYWEFGDYLGIGAGAHGKITREDGVVRTVKARHPAAYLNSPGNDESGLRVVGAEEIGFEFFLNALRLTDGVPRRFFEERTRQPLESLALPLQQAQAQGLLVLTEDRISPTPQGKRFLNDLLMLFLPEKPQG